MTNELQERLESTFITRPFNVGWVPIAAWEKLDQYCKEYYDNNRRVMLLDLMDKASSDWKYELLYADIEALHVKVAELERKMTEEKKEETPHKFRTFGGING